MTTGTAPRAERAAGVCSVAVPVALVGLAGLHAAWALGSSWPAHSSSALAEAVLSRGERERLGGGLPSPALTWAVAGALTGAAAIVRSAATGTRTRVVQRAARGVAAAFLARSIAYLPSDLIGGPQDRYQRLDVALYAPLSLALAAGTATSLRAAGA